MQRNEVISIFHSVVTDIQDVGGNRGVLITGRQEGILFFHWKKYVPETDDDSEQVIEQQELFISATNIQRIMINYQASDSYVLISTISPANMQQFTFPKGFSAQVLQFVQILAIESVKSKINTEQELMGCLSFIYDSYLAIERGYRLIDITVQNGKLMFPPDFTPLVSESKTEGVVVIQPDLHLISQFAIKAEDFVNNPIKQEELASFLTVEELKEAVKIRGLDPTIRHLVWPVLCNIIPFRHPRTKEIMDMRTQDYLSVKEQWKCVGKPQLKNHTLVKEAFATIRVDVKRTHALEEMGLGEDWSDVLTSILRTFAIWNLDVRYTQGLNDVCLNIMPVLLGGQANGYSDDEREALAFWCFASFVELIASGLVAEDMMGRQETELTAVMVIIERFHPACAHWIRVNELDDLQFLISAFILAYGRSFDYAAILRIWECCICCPAPWIFLRYFSAALLILSFPSFSLIQDCNTGKLVSLMDKVFREQDTGFLIGVALKMMERSEPQETPVNPLTEKRKFAFEADACTLFDIDYTATNVYQEVGNLFF